MTPEQTSELTAQLEAAKKRITELEKVFTELLLDYADALIGNTSRENAKAKIIHWKSKAKI